jgi:hypothetical protein
MFEKFFAAEIIEFYVPQTFHKPNTFIAASRRGRIIPFRAAQNGGGLSAPLEKSLPPVTPCPTGPGGVGGGKGIAAAVLRP